HASRERQLVRELPAALMRRLTAAALRREQRSASVQGRLAGLKLVDRQLHVPTGEALRVGEVRHSVGAHAPREREQSARRRRRGGCGGAEADIRAPRGVAAATTGGGQRERGNEQDRAEDAYPVAAIRHAASSPVQPEEIAAASERLLSAC